MITDREHWSGSGQRICHSQQLANTSSGSGPHARSLKYPTLDLLPLPGVDGSPDGNGREAQNGDRRRCDKHDSLRVAISVLDANPRRTADGVAQLHRQIARDERSICHALRWEESCQIFGESAAPDGAGDGRADGAADGVENREHGEHDGDVLVRCGGHGADLLGDDEGAAAEGDEELALFLVVSTIVSDVGRGVVLLTMTM